MFVSCDPEAINSPNGWKSRLLTLEVCPESDRATEASAEDLIAYLAWHGIDARLRKLRGQSTQAGEALIGECREAGADMLVMGAYTHSRLRQLILGGVTRHVLHHAPMTCLMCH